MNFTLDDNSSQLAYSPDSWSVQLASDTNLNEFFQRTYHVAQVDGASVNMSVSGTAVYIYGSKGPGHAGYTVQYDGTVRVSSAYADQTSFQQLLFSQVFDNAGPHFISLTARLTGPNVQGTWFDFDFVTITGTANSTPSSVPYLLPTVPPWQSSSSATPLPSSSSNTSPSPNTTPSISATSSSKSSNKVPTILAIVFGSIIGITLLLAAIYYLLHRIYEARRAKERSFRFGRTRNQSTNTLTTNTGTGVGVTIATQSQTQLAAASQSSKAQSKWKATNGSKVAVGSGGSGFTHVTTPPNSPGLEASGSSTAEREGTVRSDTALLPTRPLPPVPTFGFLSTAPIAMRFTRAGKGDADSLRTDFLQV